ncbi:hypothetical protein Celaphus_00019246, partial [Cervus elaphus hippelaphus]
MALGTGRPRCTRPVSPSENPLACFRVSAVLGLQACPHRGRRSGGEKAGGLLSAAPLLLPPRSGQADLAAIYYERVDVEGHHHGPWSPQRKDAVKAVDTVMAYLTKWIQERELQDDLNVIIFSDHGMTDISWIDKVIELYNYINLRDLQQ